ncbi:MAG: hypothetical protein QE484_19240 [Rhizobium sp.]|nr:hypothetical protein [Rhizobium sp.]
MTDGQLPSSDIYVRSIVEEQVRSLREIIRGVSQKAPLSDDALFLDHLLQMVSLAAADGLDRRRTGGGRKRSASEADGCLTDIRVDVAKMEFISQSLDRAQ